MSAERFLSGKRLAEWHREQADRMERLAGAASAEHDDWDAAECAAKAKAHRREARRIEIDA